MAPTTKEAVPSSAPAQANSTVTQGAQPQAAPRTNPIGLEVPVTVHASRYSAATRGFSKPLPPVHEETRTVIVFEQGAVVRLSASLSIGETVVLTNQQTAADVLCRVMSVKAQPGIQNYVDLEFTQRAPGFWNKGSNADSAIRNLSPTPEAPTPVVPTLPPPMEPLQQAVPALPPPLAAEPALPGPTPVATPPVASVAPPVRPVATLGAQPEVAARPPAPPAPMHTAPGPVAGASAGMRQTHSSEQPVLGGGLDWTKEAPARSNKGLIAAVAILALGGLAGGAYLFTQRTRSEQPAPAVAATAPIASSAPSASAQLQQPQTAELQSAAPEDLAPPAVSNANSNPAPAPEEKPADVPRPVRHEQAPADLVKPTSTAPQAVKQTAPLRPAVQVGSLKAPLLKNARISGSSEPPPTFSAQAGTRDVLGMGGLSGAAGPSAPAPPVAFEPPEAPVKAGGQIQMPKVISSPPPVYPELARSQGVQGIVVMDALIDASGTVAAVKVTSGPLTLRQAAMDALRRWKYQPARLNGQPTSVHISVNINFTRQ